MKLLIRKVSRRTDPFTAKQRVDAVDTGYRAIIQNSVQTLKETKEMKNKDVAGEIVPFRVIVYAAIAAEVVCHSL